MRRDVYPTEFQIEIDAVELTALYWPGYAARTSGAPDSWDPGDPGEFELIEGTAWDDVREEFRELSRSELDHLSEVRQSDIADVLAEKFDQLSVDARQAWGGW